jgi:hypothetical protein
VLQAGTARNPFNPCQPTGVRKQFSASEEVWIAGYFTERVPAGRRATLEVYRDGALLDSVEFSSGEELLCYSPTEAFPGNAAGTYRLVVRYSGRPIAEGSFVITP